MKYFVLLSCVLVVAYGLPAEVEKKIKEQILKFGGECKEEIGASDDDIAPIKAHEPPTTQNGKCFIACMHKKFGIQDADGKIDKDGSYSLVEKMKILDNDLYEKMKKVSDTCCAEVTDGADECETAMNIFTCTLREKKAVGIEPIDFSS